MKITTGKIQGMPIRVYSYKPGSEFQNILEKQIADLLREEEKKKKEKKCILD